MRWLFALKAPTLRGTRNSYNNLRRLFKLLEHDWLSNWHIILFINNTIWLIKPDFWRSLHKLDTSTKEMAWVCSARLIWDKIKFILFTKPTTRTLPLMYKFSNFELGKKHHKTFFSNKEKWNRRYISLWEFSSVLSCCSRSDLFLRHRFCESSAINFK